MIRTPDEWEFLDEVDRIMDRRMAKVTASLAEGLYGADGEGRVRELRTSILGSDSAPALVGLSAWLPEVE